MTSTNDTFKSIVKVQLLLDKLHEDLNRVRGAKPSTVRSEGDGTNDTGLAREQWDKTLLRQCLICNIVPAF